MGVFDSSLTRVQPTFSRLSQRADADWVLQLLALGSRSKHLELPAHAGAARKPPQFEHACLAPADLLQWMISNPRCLDWTALETARLADDTVTKRKALRDGDPAVIAEALDMLRTRGCRPGRGRWHVLEGETDVDCALFHENVTVFIEGKRTEPKLTTKVTWLRDRDQVVRNLDCLRVEKARAQNWYVLLIVEKETAAEADARALDRGGQRIAAALPHLDQDAVTDTWAHYAGYTTWSALQATFPDLGEA